MRIQRLHPRHWSPRLTRMTLAALWLLMMSCTLAMFALEWRGRQLSGVPFNHIVRGEGDRYYQKPTGPFDLRESITRRQAEIHEQYRHYVRWAGMAGCVLMVIFLVVLFNRPEQADST